MLETTAVWLLVVLAGISIGATSIGGVIVVPALTALLGLQLPTALAVSSLAFLATGLWALFQVESNKLTAFLSNTPLMLSALVGAFVGAYFSDLLPGSWGRAWVGTLALASGFFSLWRVKISQMQAQHAEWPSQGTQKLIGILVGTGSALSGTGGPVLLLPYLSITHRSIERSIATAQLIQIPIALAATVAHISAHRFDLSLSITVALVLVAGAMLGKKLTEQLSNAVLKTTTATLLIVTGIWFLLF